VQINVVEEATLMARRSSTVFDSGRVGTDSHPVDIATVKSASTSRLRCMNMFCLHEMG
jgi:hypothetical protein